MEQVIAVGFRKVYEDDYFSIGLDEDERFLLYKIRGYPKFSEMIRRGHDELYNITREMQRSHPVLHLIADLTDAKILLSKDIRFIGTISYPRLARAGIRNLSILLKDDFHVKMNVQKTLECMGSGVFEQVMLCPALEQAKEWFRNIHS